MSDVKSRERREDLKVGWFHTSKTWCLWQLSQDESTYVKTRRELVFKCNSYDELELRLAVMSLKLGKKSYCGVNEDWFDVYDV